MKLNKLFFLGAIAIGLVACNKNETPVNPDSKVIKSVSIKINNANMESRAIEPGVTASTKNLVKKALIIFTESAATTSKIVFVKKLDQAADLTALTATTTSNKGYTIKVPSKAAAAFVVLNSTDAIETLAAPDKTMDNVKAAVLEVNDMNQKAAVADANTTGSIVMFGAGSALTTDAAAAGFGPNANAADYYASVTVAPIVSRVEVTKVEPKTGSQITSFTVAGVYVKKFDKKVTLGGTVSDKVDYSNTTATSGIIVKNEEYYTNAAYSGASKNMRDMPATITTTNFAAYQVAAGDAPILVLKLSNIKLTGNVDYGDASKNYYVVIRGYKNGAAAVTTFTANNVYKLDVSGDNGVDVNNITEDVDAINKTVWVGVTVTPWTVVNVTPVF